MLARHDEVPDLKAHWRVLFEVTQGMVQHRLGYVQTHQRQRMATVLEWVRDLGHMAAGIEIGCCEGMMTAELAWDFDDLLAVDFLPEFFELCPKLPNVRYEEHDVETWTPEHDVDLILACEVLEHLSDPVGLLRRIAPRTERILATCPVNEHVNPDTFDLSLLDGYRIDHELDGLSVGAAAGHVWAMDMNGFRLMFEDAGLEIEREDTDGIAGYILAKGER